MGVFIANKGRVVTAVLGLAGGLGGAVGAAGRGVVGFFGPPGTPGTYFMSRLSHWLPPGTTCTPGDLKTAEKLQCSFQNYSVPKPGLTFLGRSIINYNRFDCIV